MGTAREMKIRLTGYIDVPAARMKAVQAALPAHIKQTRAEPGCVIFDVTPSPDHTGRFDVAEVFQSKAAFDAHQQRTSKSDWAELTKGIARSYLVEEID